MAELRETLTIPEAAQKLGIGRNQAYLGAKTGEIPVIRVGKRLLVPRLALEKLLSVGGPNRPGKAA